MLHDALPLVTTLHIEKASQLRIGLVSNHLRDVSEVSIYNLFDVNRRKATIQVDEDLATKSVHFLSILPNLESVAFWGKYRSSLCSLNSLELYSYGDNPSINHLLDEILGAFDCGSLPLYKLMD